MTEGKLCVDCKHFSLGDGVEPCLSCRNDPNHLGFDPETFVYESDPNGKSQHEPGAKMDAGKNRLGLVFNGFSLALQAVGAVGTYGANKYTKEGWKAVPGAKERYTDALLRHLFKEFNGEALDQDSGLSHAAHLAWNALARLEFILEEMEDDASK